MSTKHFKDSEFNCRCGCKSPPPSSELLSVLELVRLKFNSPVLVTSGYRCKKHNENVRGAKNSRHVVGDAADIYIKGIPPSDVYSYLDITFPFTYGIGAGGSFTHIDTRPNKARWSV